VIVDHLARQYQDQDAAEYDDNGRLHVLNELQVVAGIKSDVEAPPSPTSSTVSEAEDEENKNSVQESSRRLMHMGIATALAIAIHNFPEGLITFVAYTQEPAVGVVLAIGIGIHNIPEGLCVAMPIYYATESRMRAFLWGILSGVSEPIGALIGYVVLKGSMSGNAYGIMFGFVCGIMTLIVADELLPTAHQYDPKNDVVTYAFIVGMFAMALSLILFASS
jgi:zinc transporter, ZIP family